LFKIEIEIEKGEAKKMRGNIIAGSKLSLLLTMMMMVTMVKSTSLNYSDALTKSILFFEGQRSGKLPPSQRMTWRKDSALHDGSDIHVSIFSMCVLILSITIVNINSHLIKKLAYQSVSNQEILNSEGTIYINQ